MSDKQQRGVVSRGKPPPRPAPQRAAAVLHADPLTVLVQLNQLKARRQRLTRVDEAVDVLHHQLAAQADGVLEVSGGYVPVGVLAAAPLQPQSHDGQQQLDDAEDGEAGTWRGEEGDGS